MSARPNALHDGIGLATEYWPFDRVRTRRSGFFSPDRHGREVTIVPVLDAVGDMIDAVAYDLAVPAKWWLRTGLGQVLGEYALEFARGYAMPVRLCATPAEWLRHSSPLAVCLLRRDRAEAILGDVHVIREGRARAA